MSDVLIIPTQLVKQLLERIRTEAISDLQGKGISNGDLGMETDAQEVDGQVSGGLQADPHWYYTVYGRRPGKQPPIDTILGWLAKKGIHGEDISDKSLAFLIARKIGQVGTDIFTGKRPGLALPAIILKETQGFEEDIKKYFDEQIDTTIMAGLDQIFTRQN